jgi:hypothetical protein
MHVVDRDRNCNDDSGDSSHCHLAVLSVATINSDSYRTTEEGENNDGMSDIRICVRVCIW